MNFSVIYSFDCPRSQSVKQFLPPTSQRRLWRQTEGDESYDLGHLGGEWERGKHRKLVAELTRAQFDEFVSHCGLSAESTETMGSLGAPGMGVGWSPAISFNGDHDGGGLVTGYANAYVTPVPSFDAVHRGTDEDWQKKAWDRIRAAVLSVYS